MLNLSVGKSAFAVYRFEDNVSLLEDVFGKLNKRIVYKEYIDVKKCLFIVIAIFNINIIIYLINNIVTYTYI